MKKIYILIEIYSIQSFILKSKKLKDLCNSSLIAKTFFEGSKQILSDVLNIPEKNINDKFKNNITKYKLYEINGMKGALSDDKVSRIKEKLYFNIINHKVLSKKLKSDLPIEIVVCDNLDLNKMFLKIENKKKEYKENYQCKERINNYCPVCEKRKVSKIKNEKCELACDLCYKIRNYKESKFESTQSYAVRGKYSFIKLDIDNLGIKNADMDGFKAKLGLSRDVKEFSDRFDQENVDCIYSGGDDILFITTPRRLENDIEEIKQYFQKLKDKYQLTYSMSITIAKGKSDMHNVLRKLNNNLNNIKLIKGKDKTVISFLDSSESETKVVLDNIYVLEYLELIKFFNSDNNEINISSDLVNKIDSLLNKFEDKFNLDINSIFDNFIKKQIKRLFFRKMTKVDGEIYTKFEKFYNENLKYNYIVEFDKSNYLQGLKLLSLVGNYYEKSGKVKNEEK